MTTDCNKTASTVHGFRKMPGNGSQPLGGKSDPERETEVGLGEGGRVLVCAKCRSRITRQDLGMEVNGRHRHVFFNPYGRIFELGCFASARHVTPSGPRTGEFTWFPGFVWEVVACTGCNNQLGWKYTASNKGGFYGLILSCLVEEEDRH